MCFTWDIVMIKVKMIEWEELKTNDCFKTVLFWPKDLVH